MYFVYVQRSSRNHKRYIGFTEKDMQVRLSEHNYGSGRWTRNNGPFVLVHVQECDNIIEAKSLERFLKCGQGRQCLDELGI
ncbi:MAG: GIY-YIG nuclease family protein [Candidatus Omnitrophica bacterium]|nr:GIY-YIG nuclease family protein [Candidatus Omnitrophota bacterium]